MPGDPTGEARSAGVFDSTRRLLATLLAIGQNRMALLSTELEEQVAWLAALLLYAVVTLFFLGLSVLLVTVLIVVAFWDGYRLLAAGLLAGAFLLVSLACGWYFLARLRLRPPLFSASLAELAKDREELTPRP